MSERKRSKWMGWKCLCIRFQMLDHCKLMARMSIFSFLSSRWCLPSAKSQEHTFGQGRLYGYTHGGEGTAALTPWNFARCSKFTFVRGTIVHYDEMTRRLRFQIFWYDADTLSPFEPRDYVERCHGKEDDATFQRGDCNRIFRFSIWKMKMSLPQPLIIIRILVLS